MSPLCGACCFCGKEMAAREIDERDKLEHQHRMNELRAQPVTQPAVVPPPAVPAAPIAPLEAQVIARGEDASLTSGLKTLGELREQGLLDDEEYMEAKRKALHELK